MKILLLVLHVVLLLSGIARAQSLYDVLVSLEDRERVLQQRKQCEVQLRNEHNGGTSVIPDYVPIVWHSYSSAISSQVNSASWTERVGLLNQAVVEFERLNGYYMNIKSADLATVGNVIGAMRPFYDDDMQPLPRVSIDNYHLVLLELAWRIHRLRVISWPVAFKMVKANSKIGKKEEVSEWIDDLPIIDEVTPEGFTSPVTWFPNVTGQCNIIDESNPAWVVSDTNFEGLESITGTYYQSDYYTDDFIYDLEDVSLVTSQKYCESVDVLATSSATNQITGQVTLLWRSEWSVLSGVAAPATYDKNQCGYKVVGISTQGQIPISSTVPQITVAGTWVTTSSGEDYVNKQFKPTGYQYKSTSPVDYGHSYELHSSLLSRALYSIFAPDFVNGVDSLTMTSQIAKSLRIANARTTADGDLLPHPRPSLLYGIDLGPGITGADNAMVGVSNTVIDGDYAIINYPSDFLETEGTRFRCDAATRLSFIGSAADYHVVYSTLRSERTQSLPGLGHEIISGGSTYFNTSSLLQVWEMPRLRQVVSRDCVVDITYNASHFGYTIKVYRRLINQSDTNFTPGMPISISGLPLLKTWVAENSTGVAPHPDTPENLTISEDSGETFKVFDTVKSPFYPGTLTFSLAAGEQEKYKETITRNSNNNTATQKIYLDATLVSSSVYSSYNSLISDWFPQSVVTTSASKTITYTATIDENDPGTQKGRFPSTLSINYDGVQANADYTWNADGILTNFIQNPWRTDAEPQGNIYSVINKFNNATYSRVWVESADGGQRIRVYSAPDGNTADRNDLTCDWSDTIYGDAATHLPGIPKITRNKDNTGSTYLFNVSNDGGYLLTANQGKFTNDTITQGGSFVTAVNKRGYETENSYTLLNNNSSIKTSGTTFGDFTLWGAPRESTDFTTGLTSKWTYDSNLNRLASHTDALGLSSTLSGYDVLGRPTQSSVNGINSVHDFNPLSPSTTISGAATGSFTQTRDTLGRLLTANSDWNGVTNQIAINRTATENTITQTDLLGTHTATARKEDGSLVSSNGPTQAFGGDTGTAFTIDGGLFKSKTAIADIPGSFQETWTDAWGRVHRIEAPIPDGDGTTIGFTTIDYSNPTSSLSRIRVTDTAGHKTITESDPYNGAGAITRSGIDINGNGTLNAGDRYTESLTTVAAGVIKTTLQTTDNTVVGGLREVLSSTWAPATGITATTVNDGEETITVTPSYPIHPPLLYPTATITTTSSKGWSNTSKVNKLGLTTESSLTGTGTPSAKLEPTWRADGSLEEIQFTANGQIHSASFKNDGTLANLIIPEKGNILENHTIDTANGNEILTIDGITHITKFDGTEQSTSGGDVIGKTETLTPYPSETDPSASTFQKTIHPTMGADTTTDYNLAGSPIVKSYTAGPGESRTYENGLLKTISLARGGSIINNYDNNGARDLISTSWPAITSGIFTQIPAIVQGYSTDTAGRTNGISDPSGTRTVSYVKGRPATITYTTGPLKGYQLIRSRDTSGRDTGFILKRDGAIIHQIEKAPNGTSDQIEALASGDVKIIPQRDASQHITGYQWGNTNGTFATTAEQTWTRGLNGRIEAATSNVPGAPQFDYLIDPAEPNESFDPKNRRLKCATAGGTWTYDYDNHGQLISAVHDTLLTAHSTLATFSYSFDGIGRRIGDNFASNVLNQPTTWANNQNKTLHIVAHPDARVWYNGTEITDFTGTHNATIPIPGANGGWVAWNTLAIRERQGEGTGTPPISPYADPDAKAEKSGAVWVPPAIETLTYDLAGNRQSNAQWHYGWDAKNQLARARTKNLTTAPFGYDISYLYDAEGRRIQKQVTQYKNGSPVSEKIITFIWDGWDLIYERHQLPSGLTTSERSYLWGQDIANGSAGGAGGLLLIRQKQGNQTQDLYPLYDGTGHVTALTDSNKTLQASYAYGPFGEKINATGPQANSNPWRYATKYLDEETGLYYFGKRYYDPITGQWISRELLGEEESLNLYSYCHNDPVNKVDVLGLRQSTIISPDPQNRFRRNANGDWIVRLVVVEESMFSDDEYVGEAGWPLVADQSLRLSGFSEINEEGGILTSGSEFIIDTRKATGFDKNSGRDAFILASGGMVSLVAAPALIAASAPAIAAAAPGAIVSGVSNTYRVAYVVSTNPMAYAAAGGAVTTSLSLSTGDSLEDALVAGVLDGTMTRISSGPIKLPNIRLYLPRFLNPANYRIPLGQMNSGVHFPEYVGPKSDPTGKLHGKSNPYPKVLVDGYGEVPFPEGPFTPNNSSSLRGQFTSKLKADFKVWWLEQNRPWPDGIVNIHHIKPLRWGGNNSFRNLVPLIQPEQHQSFTNWWRGFKQ